MFTYTMEQELHEHLVKNFGDHFNFRYITSEMVIPGGRIDILGEDSNTIYVVELKRKEVDLKSIRQVASYLPHFREKHPDKRVVGIVAAPSIGKDVKPYELPLGVKVKTLENVYCDITQFTGNGGLRNRKIVSFQADSELIANFRKLSKDTRIPMSKLLDEAIEDLLKKRATRK